MTGLLRHQPVRFAIVGIAVALFYVLTYLALMAAGLSRPAANATAFLLAVAGQYVAQTLWTFRRPLGLPDQIVRFACTIGLGLLVSALLTGVIGPAMNWTDWMAAALVTVILPVQNYLFFRLWVFSKASLPSEQQ